MSRGSGRAGRAAPAVARGPGPLRRMGQALALLIGVGLVVGLALRSRPGAGGAGATVEPLSFEVPDPSTEGMQPQVARALAEHRERVLRQPRSHQAWGELGAVYDAHELHAEAEHCYRHATHLQPGETRWAYLYAVSRDVRGAELDEVVALYERIAATVRYPPVLFRLGDARVRRGDLIGACATFRRALELDPDFAIAHRSLGQALLVLGDLEGARTHLERAARLVPEDGNAQSSLAQLYTRMGDPARAARAAEGAARLAHHNAFPDPVMFEVRERAMGARALNERVAAHMAQGRHAQALVALDHLLEARPDDASVHLRRGECLERLGRREEALDAYQAVLRIEPRHAVARRVRELALEGE